MLKLRRLWSEKVNAIYMDQFANLLEAELCLAGAQQGSNLSARRELFNFSL